MGEEQKPNILSKMQKLSVDDTLALVGLALLFLWVGIVIGSQVLGGNPTLLPDGYVGVPDNSTVCRHDADSWKCSESEDLKIYDTTTDMLVPKERNIKAVIFCGVPQENSTEVFPCQLVPFGSAFKIRSISADAIALDYNRTLNDSEIKEIVSRANDGKQENTTTVSA